MSGSDNEYIALKEPKQKQDIQNSLKQKYFFVIKGYYVTVQKRNSYENNQCD